MVEAAREAGLGVTIHVGEEGGDMGREETAEVAERLRPGPDRPRHPRRRRIPSSCTRCATSAPCSRSARPRISSPARSRPRTPLRETLRRFVDHGVAFTIATDGPEMMRTHLRDEFELLLRIGALDEDELREANARGHAAAFRRRTAIPV